MDATYSANGRCLMKWLTVVLSSAVLAARNVFGMAIQGSAQFISVALTASAQADLLLNEPIANIAVDSVVSIRADNTGAAGTVVSSIASDTRTIVRESPLAAGGTAGVMPNADANPGVTFQAFAGETLQFNTRETAAATPTVNLAIEVIPGLA